MQLGYYSEKINGYFGTATRTAVEQFRLSNNLPESSVVDTEAFNLIFSAYAVDDGNLPFETGEPYYTVSPAPSHGAGAAVGVGTDAKADADTKSDTVVCANTDSSTRTVTRA